MKTWYVIVGSAVLAAGVATAIVLPITLNNTNNSNSYSEPSIVDLDSLGSEIQNQLDISYQEYESYVNLHQEIELKLKDQVYVSSIASLRNTNEGKVYYYSLNDGYWYEYTSANKELTAVSEPNLFEGYYIYY